MTTLARIVAQQTAAKQLCVSVREAASLTQVSESTLKRLVRDGRLRSRKVAGRRLIPVEALRQLFS